MGKCCENLSDKSLVLLHVLSVTRKRSNIIKILKKSLMSSDLLFFASPAVTHSHFGEKAVEIMVSVGLQG